MYKFVFKMLINFLGNRYATIKDFAFIPLSLFPVFSRSIGNPK